MKTRIVFISIICLLLCSFIEERKGYKVGDNATDFKLKNVNGQYLSLSDFKDAKGYILIFTCNHCPCAAKYEDRILALDKKYKTLGYPVVAINSLDIKQYPTETFVRMKSRASFKKYTFPYLSDEEQTVVAAYGAPSTPYVYIVKKSDNNLIVKYKGAIDDCMEQPESVKETYVENAIAQLLAGKEVTKSNTPVLGCTINIRKKE